MEEVVLLDTRGSSSTWTSPRSAGAHTAVCHLYVNPTAKLSGEGTYIRYGWDYTNAHQAHEHHRKHLESLPAEELGYPLEPTGNAAEVNETQKVTDEPLAQR